MREELDPVKNLKHCQNSYLSFSYGLFIMECRLKVHLDSLGQISQTLWNSCYTKNLDYEDVAEYISVFSHLFLLSAVSELFFSFLSDSICRSVFKAY